MGFKSKFFSVKGQVERLKNVAGVLKAPFTGGKVYGNTPNGTLDKVVEVVSNNPFKTAFVAGTVANIPKAVKVGKTFLSSRLPKGKIPKPGKKGYTEPGTISPQDAPRSTSTPSAAESPGLIEPSVTAGGTTTPSTPIRTPRTSKPRRATKRRAAPKRKTTRKRGRASRARRVRRSPRSRRTRKPRYGTAKQYARKGGKSVKYTKKGQPYIILADGRARFVKGKRR